MDSQQCLKLQLGGWSWVVTKSRLQMLLFMALMVRLCHYLARPTHRNVVYRWGGRMGLFADSCQRSRSSSIKSIIWCRLYEAQWIRFKHKYFSYSRKSSGTGKTLRNINMYYDDERLLFSITPAAALPVSLLLQLTSEFVALLSSVAISSFLLLPLLRRTTATIN